MKMLKLIEKRESVREYKEKKLSNSDGKAIKELFDKLPQELSEANIEVELLENGQEVYEKLNGTAGYNGVMIKAPNYLMITSDEKEDFLEAGGYVGEWLVLQCTKMDLGTCWVEVSDKSEKVKEILGLDTDKKVIAFIAVGYPAKGFGGAALFFSKKIKTLQDTGYPNVELKDKHEHSSGRKGIEEIVYLNNWGENAEVDELIKRGYDEVFHYMRLAPSWGNRQPWRFIIKNDQILLVILQDEKTDFSVEKIEAGIAMLYFQVAMHAEGLPGEWKVCTGKFQEGVEIPEDSFVAGIYSFV